MRPVLELGCRRRVAATVARVATAAPVPAARRHARPIAFAGVLVQSRGSRSRVYEAISAGQRLARHVHDLRDAALVVPPKSSVNTIGQRFCWSEATSCAQRTYAGVR
jgi:hypothetical protein